MQLLSRNDCCLHPSPPFSLHLCSSTHPLTSRANSTCLTRLSALWCKERETLTFAPRGERKRDEEGVEGREEGRRTHLHGPFAVEAEAFISPPANGAFEEKLACRRSG